MIALVLNSIPTCTNLVPHTDLLSVIATSINKNYLRKHQCPILCGLYEGAATHCHAASHTWDLCDRTTHKTTVSSAGDHPPVTESKRDPCKRENKTRAWRAKLKWGRRREKGWRTTRRRNRGMFSAWRSECEGVSDRRTAAESVFILGKYYDWCAFPDC